MIKQEELQDLEGLLSKTKAYAGDVFDWVAPLKHYEILNNLNDFLAKIEDAVENLKKQIENTYWEYELCGKISDGEYKTMEDAENSAYYKFEEQCEEESPRNGEYFQEDLTLIKRYFNEDSGDWVELERIESLVDYEHYHGDSAEHFNQRDYI